MLDNLGDNMDNLTLATNFANDLTMNKLPFKKNLEFLEVKYNNQTYNNR